MMQPAVIYPGQLIYLTVVCIVLVIFDSFLIFNSLLLLIRNFRLASKGRLTCGCYHGSGTVKFFTDDGKAVFIAAQKRGIIGEQIYVVYNPSKPASQAQLVTLSKLLLNPLSCLASITLHLVIGFFLLQSMLAGRISSALCSVLFISSLLIALPLGHCIALITVLWLRRFLPSQKEQREHS